MENIEKIDMIHLSRKIQRIEDRDINYKDNPKWKALRKIQDEIYVLKAKNEIEEMRTLQQTPYRIARKESLQSFINKYETNNKEVLNDNCRT
jgi:hypothetical protein